MKLQRPILKGIVIGLILAVALAFAFFVLPKIPSLFKYDELDSNSPEGIVASELRMERYEWLADGCPQPPVATNYTDIVGSGRNYTYTGTLSVSNFLGETNHIFHGLFATKMNDWTRTLVITTSGDIFAVEDSGQVRLLECMNYQGTLYDPYDTK